MSSPNPVCQCGAEVLGIPECCRVAEFLCKDCSAPPEKESKRTKERVCKVCLLPYPLNSEHFHGGGRGGFRDVCKNCFNEYRTAQKAKVKQESEGVL